MKIHLLVAVLAAALSTPLAAAEDEAQGRSDFPTIERVQFVEFCVREHPDRSHQEMLYKCSCAMDKMIAQMSYEDYVEASTAYLGGQIAGERGAGVRESTVGHTLSDRYRAAYRAAMKDCMITQ
jgi:hypothetical protein